ncbi:MAG: thioredoxin family protein [Verrucomicrobiae bacterium]|nr:thioredoxin family protein [Verrucomicrobiae bacterium]
MERIVLLTLAFALGTVPVAAQSARTQVRLLLSHAAARPGETVLAAVELRTPPKTHVYWRNPGEAGLPTEIAWTLPQGIVTADLRWPVPQRFNEAGLVTFGYTGTVFLICPLHIAETAATGEAVIKVNVNWLECEEMCVSGRASATATLVIGAESNPSAHATLIADAVTQLPKVETPPGLRARWIGSTTDTRQLEISWRTDAELEWADFFPDTLTNCVISPQHEFSRDAAGRAQIVLTVRNQGAQWPAQVSGVLVQKQAGQAQTEAWEIRISTAHSPATDLSTLLKMLLFAFLGGLILNVMPCVFPVIALKILGFIQQSGEAPHRVFKLGLASSAGVLVSFIALAVAVIAAQQAGKAASWGMHMQNPQFTLLLTVLVTLVSLNLFGVFEVTLGGRALDVAGKLASAPGMTGAFMTGMLTTVLATPCTAPLLAPALGFAFTQPPVVILVMFIAVGAGLALPYVLLSWRPTWLKFMPKPGPWLARFKVLMGFPMLATAVWLFSFTARRFGPHGTVWLGLFLVTLAFAAWVWGEFVQRGAKGRTLAAVVSIVTLVSSYVYALETKLNWRHTRQSVQIESDSSAEANLWKKWSPEAVAQARGQGRPVLVDFTADWCVTCKYNKLVALDTAEVRDALKRLNVAAFVADNTDEDPAIVAELRKFGRAGVPLVVVYPRATNAPPIVLPTLLTKAAVLEALAKAAE